MGLFGKDTPVPETVTDDQMKSLMDRAAKAHPEMAKVTNPEAIRRAKLGRDQAAKSRWS